MKFLREKNHEVSNVEKKNNGLHHGCALLKLHKTLRKQNTNIQTAVSLYPLVFPNIAVAGISPKMSVFKNLCIFNMVHFSPSMGLHRPIHSRYVGCVGCVGLQVVQWQHGRSVARGERQRGPSRHRIGSSKRWKIFEPGKKLQVEHLLKDNCSLHILLTIVSVASMCNYTVWLGCCFLLEI